MKISRHSKKTANFPPESKTDTPARQTTGTFFFSGRDENFLPQQKTANFPPEPKTDKPARQTTGTFFLSGRNENFPPQQKNCQFPARTTDMLKLN